MPSVDSAALGKIADYIVLVKGATREPIVKPLVSKVMAEVCAKNPEDAIFIDKVGEELAELYAVILVSQKNCVLYFFFVLRSLIYSFVSVC